MQIESLQNPRIKSLQKLQSKSRERKERGLFPVEGIQENRLALEAGYEPEEFYICSSIYDDSLNLNNFRSFNVSKNIFEKIAYRGTTGGIIGLYKKKSLLWEEIKLLDSQLIVILEAVEKPGNLGAVLRTCDGAGVDLLIICDPLADFFNPNVIRSSVGTVFTNQIISGNREEVLEWLKSKNIQIVSTFLREDTQSLYDTDLSKGAALVLGTEATGLSSFWADNSNVMIKIPMAGKVDSLNVSNAAAICIYEAVRQRVKKS